MAKKKSKPEASILLEVNGHSFTGEKRSGKWTFTCPSWPQIAENYAGAETTEGMVSAFMANALAGAITVRRLARGEG